MGKTWWEYHISSLHPGGCHGTTTNVFMIAPPKPLVLAMAFHPPTQWEYSVWLDCFWCVQDRWRWRVFFLVPLPCISNVFRFGFSPGAASVFPLVWKLFVYLTVILGRFMTNLAAGLVFRSPIWLCCVDSLFRVYFRFKANLSASVLGQQGLFLDMKHQPSLWRTLSRCLAGAAFLGVGLRYVSLWSAFTVHWGM